MKGLARDGTRWPSGARSTRPQPDGPDLWRWRAARKESFASTRAKRDL